MRSYRTICLFGLLLSLGQAQAADYQKIKASGVLRIGTASESYAPFTVFRGGKLSGWEYEVGNAIAKEMGLRPQWVVVPFDDIFTGLRANKYDIIMASLNATEERRNLVDFSEPTYCSGDVLVSKIGGPKTLKEMQGKRLAVRRNTRQHDLAQSYKGLAVVSGFRSDAETINQMLYGRYDAILTDRLVGLDYLKKYPKIIQVGSTFNPNGSYIALPKNQPALKADLNAALARVKASGAYAKITAKYFPQSIDCAKS